MRGSAYRLPPFVQIYLTMWTSTFCTFVKNDMQTNVFHILDKYIGSNGQISIIVYRNIYSVRGQRGEGVPAVFHPFHHLFLLPLHTLLHFPKHSLHLGNILCSIWRKILITFEQEKSPQQIENHSF